MRKSKLSNIETKNTTPKKKTTKHVAAPSKNQLKHNQTQNRPKLHKPDPIPKKRQITPNPDPKTTESTPTNNTTQINQLKRAEIPINKTILNLLRTYPAEETQQAIA